jgi:23S rRNA A2030 N6-methylase RlmJ
MTQIINDYDHSKKVANPGDLIKAAVLAMLITEILGRKSTESFTYLESHTGRSQYILPHTGEWRDGVGTFLSIVKEKFGVTSWRDRVVEVYPNLQPFIQTNLSRDIAPGSEYFGSSRLVLELMKHTGTAFRFHLWDTNKQVCADLQASYDSYPEILVYNSNGYEGLMQIGSASFALVDPISVAHEKDKILEVLSSLNGHSIPFLSWTALVGAPNQAFYEDFGRQTRSLYSVIQVAWKEPHDHTWGCRLIIPKEMEAVAKATAAEVVSVMNWRLT